MEGKGCSRTECPPPPPSTSPEKERVKERCNSDETTAKIEKIRREKMSDSFATLQSVVPNLFSNATRTRIIDETIAYISKLKEVIRVMEEKKRGEKVLAPTVPVPLLTQNNPSAVMTVAGRTVFFGVHIPAIPGMVSGILNVFEKHKTEVVSVAIARYENCTSLTVTAVVEEEEVVEKLKGELLVMLSQEEVKSNLSILYNE